MIHLVALLRAINVGGHRVTMDTLRARIEDLSLSDVRTLGASGNVIFCADQSVDRPGLEDRLAEHLSDSLGFPVEAFVRDLDELAQIASNDPFPQAPATEGIKRYVSFLHRPLTGEQLQALAGLEDGIVELAGVGREVHWLRHVERGTSKVTNATIERALGVSATRRNLNVVEKIVAKHR